MKQDSSAKHPSAWVVVPASAVFIAALSLLVPRALGALPDKYWETVCEFMGIHDQGHTLLYGDSLMAQLGMASRFGWQPYRNRSKGGRQATESVEQFSQALDEKTKAVVILLGTNDLGLGKPAPVIAEALESMAIAAGKRGAEVILCGILPDRSGPKGKRSPAILREVNGMIRNICRSHGLHFLDTHPLFADSAGNLKAEYTSDGLHLSRSGKDRLAQTIINTVNEIIHPPRAGHPGH